MHKLERYVEALLFHIVDIYNENWVRLLSGKSQEKDTEDQCEQLDSFMDQVRRKLALKSNLSKECNEDCRHMEDDVGIEDNPQSRSGGDGVATRRLRNDTMKTKSDALSRKRSKDSDSSRKSSTDLSNKNKVDICNSSNVQGTFRENGRKNGLLDNSRKNSLLDNSRKNSLLDNSRKNSLLDNSRKNSLLDNSRKNSLLDNSRKNSLLDNSRKNSLRDKSRKNSSDAENSGTSSFVQRMNSSKDFMKRDRRDSCKSQDFIDSTGNEGSDAMSEEFTGNNVTEEENQSVLGQTDARIIRERKPPAKILLEASAIQLVSEIRTIRSIITVMHVVEQGSFTLTRSQDLECLCYQIHADLYKLSKSDFDVISVKFT